MAATAIAWGVFLLLLAAWSIAVSQSGSEPSMRLTAMGGLLTLTLLPLYHRQPDAMILLLSLPAVAVVLGRHKLLGALLVAFTCLGRVSIPAMLNGYLLAHAPGLRESLMQSKILMFSVLSSAGDLPPESAHLLENKLAFLLVLRQQNFALLVLAVLYIIAAYALRSRRAQDSKSPLTTVA